MARPELEARFVRFAASHRARARRLAWRLVGGDQAAADDVVQDAFVKAYSDLSKFREEASLETWFFRILVRQVHSYRRWRSVRERRQADVDGDPADPEPRADDDPVLRQRILAELGRLSDGQREAFVLVYLEGFRVREAARLMGKAEGTVKSHMHRALSKLRERLADLGAGEQ